MAIEIREKAAYHYHGQHFRQTNDEWHLHVMPIHICALHIIYISLAAPPPPLQNNENRYHIHPTEQKLFYFIIIFFSCGLLVMYERY